MSWNKTNGKALFARASLVLVGIAGVWLLGAWLTSTPASRASEQLRRLTFESPIPPIGDPQLSLVKTVDNDSPAANEEIVYTLSYSTTNPGSQAFNVRLYDFLPAGTQFVSANPTASNQNGMLLFTAGSVATANQSATVRLRVKEGYRELHNHALVMADLVPPAHTSLATTVVQPWPSLSLTKTGYDVVLADAELVYTLRCDNTSAEPGRDVTVVDVLPTGLALVGADPPPDQATPPLLSWEPGDLGPGESWTAVITARAPASAGVITNTAMADAPQWVIAPQMFATRVVTEGAILWVVKQGSAPTVDVGDELVYTLRYENIGDQAATGVVLADTLPSDIEVTGVSPAPTTQTTGLVTWDLDTLDPGETGQAVITATVRGSGDRKLHNVADLTAAGAFPGHAELDTTVRPSYLYLPIMMKGY